MMTTTGAGITVMTTKATKTMGATLVALLAIVPNGASAQDADRDVMTRVVVAQSATLLEKEADALSTDQAGFERAAELYRKAADLRDEADARAIENLRKAGRLAYYLDDHDRSVRDYRRAAELAAASGRTVEALDAFYEAAWVAHADGKNVTARRMLWKVAELSRDPDFLSTATPDQVARIVALRTAIG